jgi:hypothetical protein|tara:strand:- start:1034 stop:1360 length:327 start_codon:yes stop_codon:yes gene_type:complete
MILRSIKNLFHKTIPAPKYLKNDPWFGPAVLSDLQMTFKEAYDHAVFDNQLLPEDGILESKNIHETIYRIAISSGKTTTQLNPMYELGGGSENFQEKWQSGINYNYLQ